LSYVCNTIMKTKKIKPYIKRGLIQARVTNAEMVEVVNKATIYAGGNLSEYVRIACLKYRPLNKTKIGR
jgi:hypothetical protein